MPRPANTAFCEPPNGHFEFQDGTRVRFMGINLTFSGALCEHEVTQTIADDRFRSGVNLVRFHYVDSRAAASLLDCKNGNLLDISAENFEKVGGLWDVGPGLPASIKWGECG